MYMREIPLPKSVLSAEFPALSSLRKKTREISFLLVSMRLELLRLLQMSRSSKVLKLISPANAQR